MAELVECHSGYRYAVRPVALHWEGERLQVAELLGRWRIPEGIWFRVVATDDRVFDLRYDEAGGRWQITPA